MTAATAQTDIDGQAPQNWTVLAIPDPQNPGVFNFAYDSTQAIVVAVPPGTNAENAENTALPSWVPDPVGFRAALAGQTVERETTYQGRPSRVMSIPWIDGGKTVNVVQVVQDKTPELQALSVLTKVLVGGSLVALLLAGLLGWLYSTRALVPIRASLRRQRELVADTSHELRTPLAVIRAGLARARQQPHATVSEIAPALDTVDAEVVRLSVMVDDLLALARTDAGSSDLDLRPVDLGDIAAEALEALEPLASGRGVRLTLDVEPAPMNGDHERLRRLVTVLVDNAVRHGREGGKVLVTVRRGRLDVDDDGPGIAADERARVFDRFWRGSTAAPGGNGLGLAIAAWVVDRHGGRISVERSPMGGARFRVKLTAS
jgi:signal transduction histidine kinase